jgi:hypothetical protein
MERQYPGLIEATHCRATRWAAVSSQHKLIRREGGPERLYALSDDPREVSPVSGNGYGPVSQHLASRLNVFVDRAVSHRLASRGQRRADLEDESVRQRLRGLGYID